MDILSKTDADANQNLRAVIKMFLILSHGNASLERGFSINKEILVENLKHESLIAQRVIYDAVTDAGGLIPTFNISKSMVQSMRSAYSRYKEALDEQKKKIYDRDKVMAEKKKAKIMTQELEAKKRRILTQTSEEIAAIDEEMKKWQK